MAKGISFSIKGKEYSTEPTKIDRKKLYGWTEKLALDDDGVECQLVSMDESGTTIIPKSGIGLGVLDANGKWVDRKEIKTVCLDGSPAELTPSSYGAVNPLEQKATAEELLDCTIKAVYRLAAEAEFIAAIGEDIYKFDYCYRDSYETSPAFLLVSGEELFMLTGTQNDFTFIGLDEISIIEDDEVDEEEDSDDIDFSMF